MPRRVAYGTVVRLVTMSVAAAGLARRDRPAGRLHRVAVARRRRPGRSGGQPLDGARHRRAACWRGADVARAPLTMRDIGRFYVPLALTSLLAIVVNPLVTFFLGRSRSPIESLAVLPVVTGLVFIFRSGAIAYQEVAVALAGGDPQRERDDCARRGRAGRRVGARAGRRARSRRSATRGSPRVAGLSPELAASHSGRRACWRWCRRSTTCSASSGRCSCSPGGPASSRRRRRSRRSRSASCSPPASACSTWSAPRRRRPRSSSGGSCGNLFLSRCPARARLGRNDRRTGARRPAPLEAGRERHHTTGVPARADVARGGIMVPFARLIRMSAAAAALALAGLWLSGCSEASRMETRCLTGDVPVCIQLGDMYANGRGVPRDLGRAARAYDRACSGGAVDVCNTLGEIVEQTGAIEGGLHESRAAVREGLRRGQLAGLSEPGPRRPRGATTRCGRSRCTRSRATAGGPPGATTWPPATSRARGWRRTSSRRSPSTRRPATASTSRAAPWRPASIWPARWWPRTWRPRCGSTERRCRSTPSPARRAYDADCAEADKLRTRLTLIAAAQQQTGRRRRTSHQVGPRQTGRPRRTIASCAYRRIQRLRN